MSAWIGLAVHYGNTHKEQRNHPRHLLGPEDAADILLAAQEVVQDPYDSLPPMSHSSRSSDGNADEDDLPQTLYVLLDGSEEGSSVASGAQNNQNGDDLRRRN